MPAVAEFPLPMRIVLPFLAALALLIAPRAVQVNEAFREPAGQINTITALEHLATWEPWRVTLWQQAGRLALQNRQYEQAIADLEHATTLHALDEEGMLALGEAYWAAQRREEAIAMWTPLMEAHRAPVDVFQRTVDQRLMTTWLEEALRWVGHWRQSYPQDGRAAYLFGLISLPLDEDTALQALAEAVRLDAGYREHVRLITQPLARLAADSPPQARLVEIGRSLGNLDEWALAQAAFEKAKQHDPSDALAWAFAGLARQKLRQNGSGDLAQALQLAPDSPVILALVAVTERSQGSPALAMERFAQAAALEPTRAIWQMEMGDTSAEMHDIHTGLTFYQAAAQVEPQNPQVWSGQALYSLRHELDIRGVALPAARQAAILAPRTAAYQDLMGQVMAALQDEISAERFLQHAVDVDPNYPPAHLHLAQLYLRQGKMDTAYYHLCVAGQGDGENFEAGLLAKRLLARYFGAP